MTILFHHWPSFFQRDLQEILKEEHITFDLLSWDFTKNKEEDQFAFYMQKHIDLTKYDLLLSVNYWPLLSKLCQNNHIPYVAWCYDAPFEDEHIEDTLGNEQNHVYCFDRMQAQFYQKKGFKTVYHLPLGINVKRLSAVSTSSQLCDHYRCQISFVGKLYESVADWLLQHSEEYCKGYLQALISAQREVYGAFFLADALTDSFLDRMNHSFQWPDHSLPQTITREHLTYALACEATRRDRIILLSLLGKRFHTKLFTYDKSFPMQHAEICPAVNYWNEMPYVFAASKINLNITLRSIQTGIPLRALDIMGCGGFLLSNYQEELDEHFMNGKEVVLYESIPDALEKAGYYLSHEAERAQIAEKGRSRVLQAFDMKDRLAFILQSLG